MDHNTALHRLLEAADLAKMLEELLSPGSIDKLSPASASGIRITLRSLRESMLASHDLMADALVARSRPRAENGIAAGRTSIIETKIPMPVSQTDTPSIVRQALSQEQPRAVKKDLRSSLEQLVEHSAS